MTTALKPRPKGFQLPKFGDAKRNKAEANGRLSHIILSMASDARVMENTPSLKALYAFLKVKPGERLRAWR